MAYDIKFTPLPLAVQVDTFEQKTQALVSGTTSGAINAMVSEASTTGTTVLTGSLIGFCGKAYLETSGTFTNSAGLLCGLHGLLKIIGTNTYDNSGACVVGQVHADSTHNIGAIFKAINSGSGTIDSVWDSRSVDASTYLFTYAAAGGASYGITQAQWDTIVGANRTAL